MANQPSITIPVAWGAARTDLVTIPASTSSAGVASWSAGFPTECGTPLTQGGVPPRYVDFNTILNNLSQFAIYQQCGGTFVWSNNVDYPVGCIAQGSDGNLYTALIANGPGSTVQNPVGDTSGKWARIATAGDLANVVTVSGSQTVSGAKTFSGATIFSGGVTVRNQANFSSGATFSSGMVVSGGATVNGGMVVSSGNINVERISAAATVAVDNGYTDSLGHKVALYANTYGNAGVYDVTSSAWIIYNNSAGATIIPKGVTFQSGATISGGLTVSGGIDATSIENSSGNTRLQATYSGSVKFVQVANSTGTAAVNTDFVPLTNSSYMLGKSANRWKEIWCTQSSINTSSDERIKQQIAGIPDAVLDAWGDVDWLQFKYNDAVAEKGADKARLHNGLIAQRVDDAFKAHGLDASQYGLFLYDAWEAQPAEVDEKGAVIEPAQPAGEAYGLRYTEALCMEAAYQRRRADRAKACISAIERRLNEMEAVLASLLSPVGDETYAEYAEPSAEQEQGAEDEN